MKKLLNTKNISKPIEIFSLVTLIIVTIATIFICIGCVVLFVVRNLGF